MRKEDLNLFFVIIAGLVAFILLFSTVIYPKLIEKPSTYIESYPFQFGIFDTHSNLGLTVKNSGKAHFNFCVTLSSLNEDIKIIRDFDCNEFFEKGEEYQITLRLNETYLFNREPLDFILIFSSNSGWDYKCIFEKKTDNFYEMKSCEYI